MGLPDHVPCDAVSVLPCVAVPEIVGAAVLVGTAGGGPLTTAVAAEVAEALPPPFVAVTTTSTVCPTSLAVKT